MFEGNQDVGSAPLPDMGGDFGERKSIFQKIFSKSETAIPIILIVILLVILVLAFSGWDYSTIPVIGPGLQSIFGAKQYNVLVIGQPKPVTVNNIMGSPDFTKKYKFTYREEYLLDKYPENQLKPYDFIILDQSEASSKMGFVKAIPYQLSKALESSVASGKSLVIIGNSGHVVAGNPDTYGWQEIFGTMVPVDCIQNISLESPCEVPSPVVGILENSHISKVLYGIEQIPDLAYTAQGVPGLNLTTYNVNIASGEEWMWIKDIQTKKQYPGIVVNKGLLGGKVVYISFEEWGLIPGVIHRIFEYIQ